MRDDKQTEQWQVAGPTEHAGIYYVEVLTTGGTLLRQFHVGNGPDAAADAHKIASVPDLLAEVAWLAEIARIESPRTVIGGWDWKGIHERLTALLKKTTK